MNRAPLSLVVTTRDNAATLGAIRDGRPYAAIRALWQDGLDDFAHRRAAYLLYE